MTDTKIPQNILIHIFRQDLRASDNPLLHAAATAPDGEKFDGHLPLYVIDASQIEVSGFIKDKDATSPYKPARSRVAGYHRCGPYRAKFVGEAVWDLSESLKGLGSGLFVRLGNLPEVVASLARGLAEKGAKVGAIWMTSHEGSEEKADEKAVASLCDDIGAKWKLWVDEKYFIDDRDTGLESIQQLPNVFTTYRKMQEPLRAKPRPVLPPIEKGSLPPLVDRALVPEQSAPFTIPDTLDGLVDALVTPVKDFLPNKPEFPEGAQSAHPYKGGEAAAHERLNHLILSEAVNTYQDTRNGLRGTEFSTKLSAFLAQGCITARQVHATLDAFERGTDVKFKDVKGFGAYKDKEDATEVTQDDRSEDKPKISTENSGIQAIRLELLWRDYMRLCHQKYRSKLFWLPGFQKDYKEDDGGDGSGNDGKPHKKHEWKSPVKERALPGQVPSAEGVAEILERFNAGTMGMGLIDASQRELLHTGYTSNRARQNVGSFLAKHLKIDWRYGAEWYEMLLVDYDVSSNWANWQYVAGVGNDPRSEIRIFNPIKQAFEYDKDGSYVRAWVPEVSKLKKLENVFQPCTASEEDLTEAGLVGNIMVTKPVLKIDFYVDAKPRTNKRGGFRRGGQRGGGGRHTTHGHGHGNGGETYHANGNGSGNVNGNANGNGQTHDARMDAPVVNGTTRGPGNQVAHHRGSFGGSRSPGCGRGGYSNGGGRGGYSNGSGRYQNNGNGNGNNFHNNNTNGGGAHSPSSNGGGSKYRGGGPRYSLARGGGGGGGGGFHRGGHNGSHHWDNGHGSEPSPSPDGLPPDGPPPDGPK